MNDELPAIPVEPNPFWRENAQKLVGEGISTIESVAKQIITVNSLLTGLYFHAITYSNMKPGLMAGWITVVYILPIVMWLLSIVFAMFTLSPQIYRININSSSDSKERFEEILREKYKMLKISEIIFIVSLLALMAALSHYLLAAPIA